MTKAQIQEVAVGLPRLFILAAGALFLFLFLDWKPPQHDEGVNGWIIQEVISRGYYAYDPANYHGPLHFYLLFFFRMLLGDSLWALRLSAVLFSLGALVLFLEMRRYLGRFCAYAGTFLIAVSPGMVFYSRYAIHESGLYFFSVLTFLGFFRFMHERDKRSLWFLGLGVTGMLAMKETFIIAAGCFFLAWGFTAAYERFYPSSDSRPMPPASFQTGDVIRVGTVCLLITVLLFSGFLLYWDGVLAIFKSFEAWVRTGALSTSEQKGHWKPFIYWLQLMLRYEWAALTAFLFCFPMMGSVPRWHRLLMVYAVLNFLAYSLIPYKTPWCILQILWPLLLVTAAGLGYGMRGGRAPGAAALGVLILLGAASVSKSVTLNFFRYADDSEPYAHVQTYHDIMSIDRILKEAIAQDPTLKHVKIQVIKRAYWPISWLLLDFTNGEYYTKGLPPKAGGLVIFCDRERQTELELRLKRPYLMRSYRLNPAQDPGVVYFDAQVFGRFFREPDPVFYPLPEVKPAPGEGLLMRYFDNPAWEGDPVREEIAGTVGFGWDKDDRPFQGGFGIVLEGEIYIPEQGETVFYLASDDGSELFIGGELLIDNSGEHAEETKSGKRYFREGWHPFFLRYNDVGGAASLFLWWTLPSGKTERIEPGYLRPASS